MLKPFHQFLRLNAAFPFVIRHSRHLNFDAHWHEELEWVYQLSGVLNVGLHPHTIQLEAGQSLLLPSRMSHAFVTPDRSLPNETVVIQFRLGMLDSALLRHDPFRKPLLIRTPSTDCLAALNELVARLEQERDEKLALHELAIKSKLTDLLVLLDRHATVWESNKEDGPEVTPIRRIPEHLERIQNHIEANFNKPLSTQNVAEAIGLSRSYMLKMIKDYMGTSFNEYVTRIRIRQASYLLLYSNLSVLDISERCGYPNVKTFNRLFKQLRGCAPGQYRKENDTKRN